jgi:hypothetical protein
MSVATHLIFNHLLHTVRLYKGGIGAVARESRKRKHSSWILKRIRYPRSLSRTGTHRRAPLNSRRDMNLQHFAVDQYDEANAAQFPMGASRYRAGEPRLVRHRGEGYRARC